jgi:hypothetical protein
MFGLVIARRHAVGQHAAGNGRRRLNVGGWRRIPDIFLVVTIM